MRARRIADNGRARINIPGDHAAGADDRIVPYGHAGQDDSAAADPHVAPDMDRTSEFKAGFPFRETARVVGGQ